MRLEKSDREIDGKIWKKKGCEVESIKRREMYIFREREMGLVRVRKRKKGS